MARWKNLLAPIGGGELLGVDASAEPMNSRSLVSSLIAFGLVSKIKESYKLGFGASILLRGATIPSVAPRPHSAGQAFIRLNLFGEIRD